MPQEKTSTSPCPACDGAVEDRLPLKGQGKRCLHCKSAIRWDFSLMRWVEIDPLPTREREVIRYHARDLTRLPPLQLTAGGRLVQRCISCWDEVEILSSNQIVIGRQFFVPLKPPSDPPPPDWVEKWIPLTKTQKGPGCLTCLRDYTAYVGRRGETVSISKEGKRRHHTAPYIPVSKEHMEDVLGWLAGTTPLESLGYKLLVGVNVSVPSTLALRFSRSCERRFGEPSQVKDLSPWGTGLIWDGPLALDKILPLKAAIDRAFVPQLRQGLVVVVENDHRKLIQHLDTLSKGGTVVACWGEQVKREAIEFAEVPS